MADEVDAYFAPGTSRYDAHKLVVDVMKPRYDHHDFTGATEAGFDILREMEKAHDGTTASPVGTPSQGSTLANDVIGCMTALNQPPAGIIDFTSSLGTDGGFAVRGGASDLNSATVFTKNKHAAIKPPAHGFLGWVDTRVLFYSGPIGTTFLTERPVGTYGYRWSTVPERHSFNVAAWGAGTFGMCVSESDRDRLQEVDPLGPPKILPLVTNVITTLGLDCSTPSSSAATGLLGHLSQLAATLLLPEPAYAAALGGGTGGLLGGLSDIGVVDPVSVGVAAASNVRDSRVNRPIPPFTVTARAAGGSLLPGVVITIAVYGNNGSWTLAGTLSRTTDASGTVTFNDVTLDKPGGYTFSATSSYVGFPTPTVALTNMFHIKQ